MIRGVFMQIKEVKYDWAGELLKRITIDTIVLHHAEASSCTAKDIHWWHICRGYSGIGYHYFINKKGEIFKGRPDNTVGAHAKGFNSTSIGICFEGRLNKEIMPQAQLQAGKELVEYLKNKYNIKKIKKHSDLMATDCPGKLFPFEEIVGQLKENLILSFQRAVIADGVKLPKYGADGTYGSETSQAMQKCIVKKRVIYKYKNCTKLVQRLLGITQDGLCGKDTDLAIRKFQQENNLQVDGAVGKCTWEKLLNIK